MDADQIAAIAGPMLIVAGLVVLAVVALRPPRTADGVVRLVLDDGADDDVHPGLDALPNDRLPAGAARVLASLTEITPDPRNQRGIATTQPAASHVANQLGDPDTGVIRVIARSEIQQPVPSAALGRHPAASTEQ